MHLRIAMLSAHSCPVGQLGTKDTGGMSVCIRELSSELGKLGHKVDVFTRVHDPRDPVSEPLGKNARLVHLRVGGEETMDKLVLFAYLPDFACALEAFRKEHDLKYDLIFSHYWLSGVVGQEVREWWDVPNFVMFHTLAVVKNGLGVGEREPDLRVEKEKEIARSCDRVIAATSHEKDVLVDLCGASPDRIGVVPCGVNLRVFHPSDRAEARAKLGFGDERTVLFVGRIEPLKGVDLLIKAFASLPPSPTAKRRLVIIGGDGDGHRDMRKLAELSDDLGLNGSVTFAGSVRHDLMPSYYNAADLCVVPSHYESFGLVALESLACGTPVVATDVGVVRDIIKQGETGFVVPDRSVSEMADRIGEVLSWPDRSLRRSREIRASVADHSWASIAAQINGQFEDVLRERSAV
jgi:D-inositol-3-phosphate glycosyltransferase